MSSTWSGVEVYVNERGPFRGVVNIETERIDITVGSPTYGPDPAWTHVDKAGHFHAYGRDNALPTLEKYEKHIGCDGQCGGGCGDEGYTETRYRCRLCRKRVKPGRAMKTYGGEQKSMLGRTSWWVTVQSRTQWNTDVSVRVVAGKRTAFGLATPRMSSASPDGFTFDFIGISELAERTTSGEAGERSDTPNASDLGGDR